MVGVEQAKVVV